MTVLIVGNGSLDEEALFKEAVSEADLVICADGGAKHFEKSDIYPDVLLGDFDSIEQDTLQKMKNKKVKIEKFPTRKDYTDMELALDYAIRQKASRIVMMGAAGSRLDHTLANLQLLHKALDAGIQAILLDDRNTVYLIEDNVELCKKNGYQLSLLPATPVVEGITTHGLSYPLQNATMMMGTGLGISNEFALEKASVSLRRGRLYVILSKD